MNFLYKIIMLVSVVFIVMMTNGCDYCNEYQGDGVMVEKDIYFTSSPVNSNETGIYRITIDGKEMARVVNNAEIYSKPSKTKKIVYTSFVAVDTKYIFKSNIDGSNPEVVKDEKFSNNMLFPQISSDGKYIVVNDVKGTLWLIKEDNSVLKLTEKFCLNTLPSISPDGTKLAYYEGGELFNPLTVVVLDMEKNPPVEIVRKEHDKGIIKYSGDATIAWTPDSRKICYVISKDKLTDYLYIGDYNSPDDRAYEITSIGAYQPSITSDLSRVVFAARDGNLWIRDLHSTTRRYIRLTSTGRISKSLYPEWSKDEKHILYIRQFKDEADIMKASLEIIDLDSEPPVSRVLSNNVYRGYWNYK